MREASLAVLVVLWTFGCGADATNSEGPTMPETRRGGDEPSAEEPAEPSDDGDDAVEGPALDPVPAPPPGAPVGDRALIEAVRVRWSALRATSHAAHPLASRVDALIASPPRPPRVSTRSCADARREIEERDPNGEDLLDGTLDSLRTGECRVITYDALMGPGFEALARPDGHVLVLRIVGEG